MNLLPCRVKPTFSCQTIYHNFRRLKRNIAGKGKLPFKFGEVTKKKSVSLWKPWYFYGDFMQEYTACLHTNTENAKMLRECVYNTSYAAGMEVNEALLAKRSGFRYAKREVRDMNHREIGKLLLRLRKEQGLTQKQVAEKLCVSAQAVSKWERGLGCPDVSLLPGLSQIFGVGAERLLSGSLSPEPMEAGNMKRIKFYVCPDCGNILTSAGKGELHCCGRRLEALVPQTADEDHRVSIQEIEEDWYVTFAHPMRKDHYFRFAAYVTVDRVLLVRLYPEQGSEFRIPQIRGGGQLYLCCSRDGLMKQSK